ncbi:MAG: hypothetical protein ACREJC_10775, partial [Tepidisphaeraceae bacterium]
AMTVRIYASTDASAPVLTGEANKLNDLLLACLVNGYGSKLPAGWTRPFYDAATGQGSYKSNAAPFAWLHVQDNGQSAGGMREARMRGYEDMSSYSAGTGPHPTVAQMANGYTVRKSQSADATPRAWLLAADGHRFYLFTYTGDNPNITCNFVYGRIRSFKSGDNYANHITGRETENNITQTNVVDQLLVIRQTKFAATDGHIARSYTGIGGSVGASKISDSAKTEQGSTAELGGFGLAYPYQVDGGLYLAKLYICESGFVRGELPGIWNPLHDRPLLDGDTFSGVTDLAAKSFRAVRCSTAGELFLETSDTWDV